MLWSDFVAKGYHDGTKVLTAQVHFGDLPGFPSLSPKQRQDLGAPRIITGPAFIQQTVDRREITTKQDILNRIRIL